VIESVSEEKTYGDTRTEFTYPVIKDLIDKRIEEKVNNTLKARIEDYRQYGMKFRSDQKKYLA